MTKYVVMILAVTTSTMALAGTEYVKLTASNGVPASIEIAENQTVLLMDSAGNFADTNGLNRTPHVELGNTGHFTEMFPETSNARTGPVDGPCKFWLYPSAGGMVYAVLKVTTKDGSMVPGGTIVIPNDHRGAVNIHLECSADMVNWTNAPPGLYETSSTNRFFRIRGVRQDQ